MTVVNSYHFIAGSAEQGIGRRLEGNGVAAAEGQRLSGTVFGQLWRVTENHTRNRESSLKLYSHETREHLRLVCLSRLFLWR
jgi:hypothetical protein